MKSQKKKKLNEEKEIPWKMGFLNSKLNQNLKFYSLDPHYQMKKLFKLKKLWKRGVSH